MLRFGAGTGALDMEEDQSFLGTKTSVLCAPSIRLDGLALGTVLARVCVLGVYLAVHTYGDLVHGGDRSTVMRVHVFMTSSCITLHFRPKSLDVKFQVCNFRLYFYIYTISITR